MTPYRVRVLFQHLLEDSADEYGSVAQYLLESPQLRFGPRITVYLRQNVVVTSTRSGKISSRPRIIASAQIQLWKSVRLA